MVFSYSNSNVILYFEIKQFFTLLSEVKIHTFLNCHHLRTSSGITMTPHTIPPLSTVCAASALRYHDVGQSGQEKNIIAFFNDGLSPWCALDAFHKRLENETNNVTTICEGQIVPDFFFVNR